MKSDMFTFFPTPYKHIFIELHIRENAASPSSTPFFPSLFEAYAFAHPTATVFFLLHSHPVFSTQGKTSEADVSEDFAVLFVCF